MFEFFIFNSLFVKLGGNYRFNSVKGLLENEYGRDVNELRSLFFNFI